MRMLKQSLNEFKIYCEKSINDLKEKINGKYIGNKDNNVNEIILQINNLESKYDEMNRNVGQKTENLKDNFECKSTP